MRPNNKLNTNIKITDHFSIMAPPFYEAVRTIIMDAVTLAVAEE